MEKFIERKYYIARTKFSAIFGDLANSLAKRASGGKQGAGIARRSRIF
jgi:hypothetical protein